VSGKEDYFSSEHLHTDLKAKTVRGGIVAASAQGVTVILSLAAIPILSRLLDPADFGLIAMVSVFTGVAAMFVDAGLTMATVQRDELTHEQVSSMFWIATALGLLVALIVAASSPAVAWFYDEPRLVPVTWAMASGPFLGGLTIQHQALLRRNMRLAQLAAVQVVSAFFGYAVAIAVAWRFRSYWALVVLPVSVAALRMAGTWAACSWRPSLPRRGAGVRAMVGFGANLTGFNFVNYFARSGDNLLIGWAWGDTALGFYERAYKLMMAPLQQINGPLAGVMIPALSRLNGQPIPYRAAYFRSISVLQLVACPLMAFVAVMAPDVVRIAFGPDFGEAGPILRWLAIAGFIQPLLSSLGWLYVSQGRGRDLRNWGLVGCTLIVLSFVVGLPSGPLGVARAYAIMTCLVVAPLAIWFAGAAGAVTRADLARSCGLALVSAAPIVAVTSLVAYVVRPASSWDALALGATGSVIASAPLLLLTRRGRWILEQFKQIALQARDIGIGREATPPVLEASNEPKS